MPECRIGPVSANEFNLVSERKQFVANRLNKIVVIAARKISAANRAGKNHVANHSKFFITVKKYHVPRRMTGTVQHLEYEFANRDRIAVKQPSIRRERLNRRETIGLGLLRQTLQLKIVSDMRSFDLHPKVFREHARA